MNEVTKLYENAGVEPTVRDNAIGRGYYIEHQRIEEYPPFTAEKQLELIKWLLKNFDIDFSQLGQNLIYTSLDGINCIGSVVSANTFEDSLCMAVNDLWQDLTEEERKQIKEILE